MVSDNKRILTAFRLTRHSINLLRDLKEEVNRNSAIKITMADIVEMLIRQTTGEKLTKKMQSLGDKRLA